MLARSSAHVRLVDRVARRPVLAERHRPEVNRMNRQDCITGYLQRIDCVGEHRVFAVEPVDLVEFVLLANAVYQFGNLCVGMSLQPRECRVDQLTELLVCVLSNLEVTEKINLIFGEHHCVRLIIFLEALIRETELQSGRWNFFVFVLRTYVVSLPVAADTPIAG